MAATNILNLLFGTWGPVSGTDLYLKHQFPTSSLLGSLAFSLVLQKHCFGYKFLGTVKTTVCFWSFKVKFLKVAMGS